MLWHYSRMTDSSNGGNGDGGFVPFSMSGPSVPHYYGDNVRQFFLGGSALMLIAAPFYAENLKQELPFEVVGALILVSLAAITNPWKQSIMAMNVIAAGIVAAAYQTWALLWYNETQLTEFVLRQAIAFAFLFAFYFAVKTLRAMMLEQVGKAPRYGEFQDDEKDAEEDRRVRNVLAEGADSD